jgi:asparagine synthase (glutamine-hydrolysing)
MCAIYGLLAADRPLTERERVWVPRAASVLAHRGPDGDDAVDLLDGRCVIGHRRLAIIDLETGAQPIANEDGTIWAVTNGEIYNYLELREELRAKGHAFRTDGDSEVLVHLYEEVGPALVDRLVGMFAFAIVDERTRRLFMARDRFGEKPLYWTIGEGGRFIAFASEMKALSNLHSVDRTLDHAALAQFLLLRYIPAPRTHLTGIRKLAAGEALSFSPGQGMMRWKYWSPDWSRTMDAPPSRAQGVDMVRAQLRESVRLQLRSDVPVGAFLSGGIDSTAIVCAMRDLMPDRPIETFSVGFEDPALDETAAAREVASAIGSTHRELRLSATAALGTFGELVDHCDEPFADPSLLPTFLICQAARETCKVMLSGDGGDECFGGYREHFSYYRWNVVRRLRAARACARRLQERWPHNTRGAGLLKFIASDDRTLLNGAGLGPLGLLSAECRTAAAPGIEELEARTTHHARLPFPRASIEKTASLYLPDQILVKVDRASMRVGLETRAPFLDHRLMELSRRLPVEYQFSRGFGKALLRDALPAWVPDSIRWRQKRGFTPPLAAWLRTTIKADMEASFEDLPEWLRPLLQPQAARQLFDRHLCGEDHSDLLFRWLVMTRRCAAATE